MRIVLSGVETNNKGAELMLYAILQEIEHRHSDAEVFISRSRVRQGFGYVKTTLRMNSLPYERLVERTHINGILRRIGAPSIECMNLINADLFLDGSGFLFSDQCKLWGTTPQWWERLLINQKRHGTKIVFLPQAFGPFNMEITKKAIGVISAYSDLIYAREQVSYNYLQDSGIVKMEKVRRCPDFTSLVDGVFPVKYDHLRNGICIIPNIRMIRNGKISYEDYIQLLVLLVHEGRKSGHPVYLLNHEGLGDAELCLKCKECLGEDIEAVINLNALEVKGLIASAFLVITSRFHGLASSLNSCVPGLATSWSHKYEELFKDYGLDNYVLPLDDNNAAVNRVRKLCDEKMNLLIKKQLQSAVPQIKTKTKEMWDEIWNLL